jgi:hypothetical protein
MEEEVGVLIDFQSKSPSLDQKVMTFQKIMAFIEFHLSVRNLQKGGAVKYFNAILKAWRLSRARTRVIP